MLAANTGRTDCTSKFLKSAKIEFETCIHADFFKIYRYLPNNCDVNIKFNRNSDSFSFFNVKGNIKSYSIKISDLILSVRRVELHPDVLRANEKLFKSNKLAVLPMDRNQIKTFVLPSGIGSQTLPSVIRGQLPRSVIIGIVLGEAFNGSQFHNPFNFQNCNLKNI
jgi:hypothetical protein